MSLFSSTRSAASFPETIFEQDVLEQGLRVNPGPGEEMPPPYDQICSEPFSEFDRIEVRPVSPIPSAQPRSTSQPRRRKQIFNKQCLACFANSLDIILYLCVVFFVLIAFTAIYRALDLPFFIKKIEEELAHIPPNVTITVDNNTVVVTPDFN